MKEIIVRTISGVLYISIIIFSMFTSREWFMGLFFILGAVTVGEFLKLVKLKTVLAYIQLAICLYFLSYRGYESIIVLVFLSITLAINFVLMKDLFSANKVIQFKGKKFFTIVFYLVGGFLFLTLIPMQNGSFTPEVIVGLFILVWSNDTLAYVVGKSFGKRKLLERVSPKKTIEGFVGGIVGAICASFVIFRYIEIYPLWVWITLGIIASLFGTIGDLIESKFKREAGVKDSGIIMPGHGGLYDRLDSIIYASPFAYAFLQIVNYVS